jgi:hypothetical protein
VTPNSYEPRPGNKTANNSYPANPSSLQWGPSATDPYWAIWRADVLKVTGHYTSPSTITTTMVIQWAACKWGLDEDTLRAQAVVESGWDQSWRGDICGTDPSIGSFSIIQIKNRYCDDSLASGGMPATQSSTALALDFFGAHLRACYDGAFYDGGAWLYGGKTVDQIAATSGWDYVYWGCIGNWYSGGWHDSGAETYIAEVKLDLANRVWTKY